MTTSPDDNLADLRDISQKVQQVSIPQPGGFAGVNGYLHGVNTYVDDGTMARIAAHLTGRRDLSGRTVRIERDLLPGWVESRGGREPRRLPERTINGVVHYRLNEDWDSTTH